PTCRRINDTYFNRVGTVYQSVLGCGTYTGYCSILEYAQAQKPRTFHYMENILRIFYHFFIYTCNGCCYLCLPQRNGKKFDALAHCQLWCHHCWRVMSESDGIVAGIKTQPSATDSSYDGRMVSFNFHWK